MKRVATTIRQSRIDYLVSNLDRIEYSFAIFNSKDECGYREYDRAVKDSDNISILLHRLSDRELKILKKCSVHYDDITLNDLMGTQSFSFHFNGKPRGFVAIYKTSHFDYDIDGEI